MKKSSNQTSGGLLAGLALAALLISFTHPAQSRNSAAAENTDDRSHLAGVAPFIVQDTQSDSPGTNQINFSVEIGGTPPPSLQWKVDTDGHFNDIPGATNATYRIGSAQVVHNGFYALFATNSAGSLHTTPQRIFVEEGED